MTARRLPYYSQRVVAAIRAARATYVAANERRIHVTTRGRRMTVSAHPGSERTVQSEHHQRHRHEHRAEIQHLTDRWSGRVDELRQERDEEQRQLRVEGVDDDRGPG